MESVMFPDYVYKVKVKRQEISQHGQELKDERTEVLPNKLYKPVYLKALEFSVQCSLGRLQTDRISFAIPIPAANGTIRETKITWNKTFFP